MNAEIIPVIFSPMKRPAALLTQLATIAGQSDPGNWLTDVAAFQKAAGRGDRF